MDSSVGCWDIRPFVENENNRFELNYEGVHHGAEKNLLRCSWSSNQEMISCGSADRTVRIYDSSNANMLYCLGGHKGSVNEVIFHPTEPIIASCGSDKVIYLGELME
jgi:Prp8 binding protein